MTKKLLLVPALMLGLVALALVGCEDDAEPVEDGGDGEAVEGEAAGGDAAVDFTAKGFDGETYKLSDYEGDLIFLNCFTTWCAPCKEEMPHLISLAEEYADQGEKRHEG